MNCVDPSSLNLQPLRDRAQINQALNYRVKFQTAIALPTQAHSISDRLTQRQKAMLCYLSWILRDRPITMITAIAVKE